jgi:hypothetical protein
MEMINTEAVPVEGGRHRRHDWAQRAYSGDYKSSLSSERGMEGMIYTQISEQTSLSQSILSRALNFTLERLQNNTSKDRDMHLTPISLQGMLSRV